MSSSDIRRTKKLDTGIWQQNPCLLCSILIFMVQKDVCPNFFSILTQEYNVVRIKGKIASMLRFQIWCKQSVITLSSIYYST